MTTVRRWAGDFRGIAFADVTEPIVETLDYYPTYRWGTLRIFYLKIPKDANVWATYKEWYSRRNPTAVTRHVEYLIVSGTRAWRYTLVEGGAEEPDVLCEGEDWAKNPDFTYVAEVRPNP